ncbi:uncharacterized protein LOC134838953 isoform X2 [Symsagittifera roscoffensis]|uniref:uncharacterized protein LOC134838953 isoform X2 n=1 Tax=Symsagittifera roscoffensis TaxID=84072 RepID=UPI00307C300F
MPHKRSSSDVTVDARIGSTSPFKQPNENVVTRRSSNDNIAKNLLADKIDGGKLTPTKSADKQGNDPPPESARTEFTEDETPRATFINNCCRLLLLSDKTPKSYRVAECCLPDVVLVHYKNDSSVLSDLLRDAVYKCGDKRVLSVAFMCHSQDSMIHLCSSVEKHFTQNPITIPEIKNFFLGIKELMALGNHDATEIDSETNLCKNRVDFLGMRVTPGLNVFIEDLGKFLQVNVGLSQDTGGCDIRLEKEKDCLSADATPSYVGQFYFDVEKLRALTMSVPQSMAGFEKIRLVGKGAYGAAVLYRKKDDDTLVILKEINMIDLGAAERQLALNEVKILSLLDHPNIISYFDHFEEDGVLIIEMEYADGGTLAQMLIQRGPDEPMEEGEILVLFQQMVAALRHIHSHHILHRDFKTDNIFLTKEGIVKLGDFGISKMMTSTRRLASTVLGTPYYISPELCEGKEYNEKSDIWALGCVLYEMACGQRTFDGTNLPALVTKIMKGQFAPIKSTFSQPFRVLIRDMLQRDPQYRPSSHELLYMRLPELMKNVPTAADKRGKLTSGLSLKSDLDGSNDGSQKGSNRVSDSANARSLVFEFNLQSLRIEPIAFPFRVKIKQFCASATHTVCVSAEMSVFTWGEGSKGQLGHESLESCAVPTEVESLRGKSIVRVGAGDGFSVFGCDNGILLTAGDGTRGCLGHGDWNNSSKAKLIESLLSVDIVSFACGPMHVAAVSSEGIMYCWGVGADGRLGLNDFQDRNLPTQVSAPDAEGFLIRRVFCGMDGTVFLADMGCVLACGNNSFNKLGLNNRQGFLMGMKNFISKIEVESSSVPVVVKCLAKHRVTNVALGRSHTAVLVEQGQVYLLGNNADGQLGIGSVKQKNSPVLVKELEQEKAVSLCCGETFSMILNSDNQVYFMGTLPKPAASLSAPATPIVANMEFPPASVADNLVISDNGLDNSTNSAPGDPSGSGSGPQIYSILKAPRSPIAARSISKDGIGDVTNLTQCSELGCGDSFAAPEAMGLKRYHDFTVSTIDTTYICSSRPHYRVQTPFITPDANSSKSESTESGSSASGVSSLRRSKVHEARLSVSDAPKISIPRLSFSCMVPDSMSISTENTPTGDPYGFDRFSDSCSRKKCSTALGYSKVPLSNVPDEIGLAFHVMEPITSPVLAATVLTNFVLDSIPDQSRPTSGLVQQNASSKPSSATSTSQGKDSENVVVRSGMTRYKTSIRELVSCGFLSHSVLLSVETNAPMPRRKTRRRRVKRQKDTSPTVEASATSELVRKENIRGHHKRYSSAASSADGEYTTEADTETSGPEEHTDNNLKDTTTSTVPTWLKNELDDDFLPIPSSTGPDSCYSSEEESGLQTRPATSANEAKRTQRVKKDPNLRPNAADNSADKKNLGGAAQATRNQPNLNSLYMSTSNSSADLMLVQDNAVAQERSAKTARAAVSRPTTGKGPRSNNTAIQKPGTVKRNAATVAAYNGGAANINRPANSQNPKTRSNSKDNQGKTAIANSNAASAQQQVSKPTAVVAPVDSRKERGEVNVKSTNERRLEEELALMKREKEDMQRMIEQMRDQLASVTPAQEVSPMTLATPVNASPIEAALREELTQMRNEIQNQGRTLAVNAAELSRMQERMHGTSETPSHTHGNKSSLPSLSSDSRSERSEDDKYGSSRTSSGRPKSKSSKVCSVS